MSTNLDTELQPDDPVSLDAALRTDKTDRRYIDDQILSLQRHMVDALLSGQVSTWAELTGDTVVSGDNVCLVGENGIGIPVVTKATPSALSSAASNYGIVLLGGGDTSRIRVALAGAVPPEVTGLPASATGAVRVGSDARCERVSVLGSGDYPVGVVGAGGHLQIVQSINPALYTAGGGGGGGLGDPTAITAITANYTALQSDIYIAVGAISAAITINLSTSPILGDKLTIKDCLGNAATKNITVNGGPKLVDGFTTFVMNANFSSLDLTYSGVRWSIG